MVFVPQWLIANKEKTDPTNLSFLSTLLDMTMRFPSISIVVPVYNVEPYIEDCLRSVAVQTYQGEVECVLVDDCGKDRSMELVDKFVQSYQGPIRFRIHHRAVNGGLSAARNDGMRLAKGEYIYFLDSDDELTPNCLESLAKPLCGQSFDMVIGDYKTTGTTKEYPPVLLADGSVLHRIEILHSYVRSEWYMMAWNKLYRKDFLVESGLTFLEGIIHEDELWSFQVATLAKSMHVVRDVCYIYKLREGSITTATARYRRMQCLGEILLRIASFSKENGIIRDRLVHHWVQRRLFYLLSEIYGTGMNDLFEQTYLAFRQIRVESPLFAFCRNGLRLTAHIRDFHLLLPIPLGLRVERWLVKRLS